MIIFEEKINAAIDLFADGNETQFHTDMEELINKLKDEFKTAKLTPQDVLETWALCLTLTDDFELALLKYEEALKLDPLNDELVWKMVEILLHNQQEPSSAKTLLTERLLKNEPENEDYLEALKMADLALNQGVRPDDYEAPKAKTDS